MSKITLTFPAGQIQPLVNTLASFDRRGFSSPPILYLTQEKIINNQWDKSNVKFEIVENIVDPPQVVEITYGEIILQDFPNNTLMVIDFPMKPLTIRDYIYYKDAGTELFKAIIEKATTLGIDLLSSDSPELMEIAESTRQSLQELTGNGLPEDTVSKNQLQVGFVAKRGMNDWRKRRANLFKETKEQNPDYKMDQLAGQAGKIALERIEDVIKENNVGLTVSQLGVMAENEFERQYGQKETNFTRDDVKNDYRDMGWKWKRSSKIT